MPKRDRAPRWAIPLLAALVVARSKGQYLRQLDDTAFRQLGRACDQFVLWTTIPGLTVAAALLPRLTGVYLLLGFSVWGIMLMLAIGRRVSLERRRRAGLTR